VIEGAGRLVAEIWKDRTGRIGLVLVVLILLFALAGPLIAADPNKINVPDRFLSPSLSHLLGTDNLGRDLFARTAYGTRSALAIALVVVGLSLSIGAVIGVAAGLIGGFFERIVLMLFDIINAYPPVTLALGMVALYGTGYTNLLLVVTILFIPQFGRVARAQTLAIRNQTFIDAERLLGLPLHRLILRHFVPNVIGPLIILASMNIPVVVTVEAGISFLGLGVQPPSASLGSLIKDGYIYLSQSWWPTIGSAVTLALATLGSTLFGEALRDAFDPKLKGRLR
jgi:peptide/nickel transport system permease protein